MDFPCFSFPFDLVVADDDVVDVVDVNVDIVVIVVVAVVVVFPFLFFFKFDHDGRTSPYYPSSNTRQV